MPKQKYLISPIYLLKLVIPKTKSSSDVLKCNYYPKPLLLIGQETHNSKNNGIYRKCFEKMYKAGI